MIMLTMKVIHDIVSVGKSDTQNCPWFNYFRQHSKTLVFLNVCLKKVPHLIMEMDYVP